MSFAVGLDVESERFGFAAEEVLAGAQGDTGLSSER